MCKRLYIRFGAPGAGILALWFLLIVGSSWSKIILVLQKFLYRVRVFHRNYIISESFVQLALDLPDVLDITEWISDM
jgi:hypothetical protein